MGKVIQLFSTAARPTDGSLDVWETFRRRAGERAQRTGKYISVQDYCIENGQIYVSQKLTAAERRVVFAAVDRCKGKRFLVKTPFLNAQRLAAAAPELCYVEGYSAHPGSGKPVLHAWVEINEKVIDLTLRLPKRRKSGRMPDRIMGEFPGTFHYFGVALEDVPVTGRPAIADWQAGFPLLNVGD